MWRTPLSFECPLVIGCNNLFIALIVYAQMSSGRFNRTVPFGTTTIGPAQGDTLLAIIPAFSSVSNSFLPSLCCFISVV